MTLQDALKDYQHRTLSCNPSFAQTIPSIIELVNLYWNSRYRSGDLDENGQRKNFFNVVQGPTWVKTKEIDLDIKHILLRATSFPLHLKVWFFNLELRHKLLADHWGSFLNTLGFLISKDGHVVVKKNKGGIPDIVDLRNFFVDPTAENLQRASYIIEQFFFLPSEFQTRFPDIKPIPKQNEEGYIPVYEKVLPKLFFWMKTVIFEFFLNTVWREEIHCS